MCLIKKMFWGIFSKNVAVALNLSNCWADHHLWEGFDYDFLVIPLNFKENCIRYSRVRPHFQNVSQKHFWIFSTAVPLPITQSAHGLEGMDKENSLDWFFSVILPKTKTIWNELEILRHIYQSGGYVGDLGSHRSHLGTLNNIQHIVGLPCALSWLYFLHGSSGIRLTLSQCLAL